MIAEQLNPDSKEIVLMPEQTLLKHVEDILERKFDQDERRLMVSSIAPTSNVMSHTPGSRSNHSQQAQSGVPLSVMINQN